jgi:hypothetical protein
MSIRWRVSIATLTVVGLVSGCATTRSTIDMPGAPTAAPTQPAAARAFVKITDLKDLRRFEAAPKDPSTPSLENPAEIQNRAITSRAVARKRGGFGAALADILLPEGRTVEQVVREAVTKALLEQGYAVVDATSSEFSKALPLQVDIDQFWAWFTPGFATVQVEFRGLLMLKGEAVTGRKEAIVQGYGIVKGMVITDAEWREVLVAGVNDLTKNTKAVIKPAP